MCYYLNVQLRGQRVNCVLKLITLFTQRSFRDYEKIKPKSKTEIVKLPQQANNDQY